VKQHSDRKERGIRFTHVGLNARSKFPGPMSDWSRRNQDNWVRKAYGRDCIEVIDGENKKVIAPCNMKDQVLYKLEIEAQVIFKKPIAIANNYKEKGTGWHSLGIAAHKNSIEFPFPQNSDSDSIEPIEVMGKWFS